MRIVLADYFFLKLTEPVLIRTEVVGGWVHFGPQQGVDIMGRQDGEQRVELT